MCFCAVKFLALILKESEKMVVEQKFVNGGYFPAICRLCFFAANLKGAFCSHFLTALSLLIFSFRVGDLISSTK